MKTTLPSDRGDFSNTDISDLSFVCACDIIQLMHSFEVNIRICQPENSDVHRGEAEVNITFEG